MQGEVASPGRARGNMVSPYSVEHPGHGCTHAHPRHVLFRLELRVGLLEVACIRPTMPAQECSPLQSVCRQEGGDSQTEDNPLAHMAPFRAPCPDTAALRLPSDLVDVPKEWRRGGGHTENRAKEHLRNDSSGLIPSWDDVIVPGSTNWAGLRQVLCTRAWGFFFFFLLFCKPCQ